MHSILRGPQVHELRRRQQMYFFFVFVRVGVFVGVCILHLCGDFVPLVVCVFWLACVLMWVLCV